jgi:biotin transport system substrate-specific component
VYAGHTHGWAELTGPSGGYIAGFLLASAFIGWQARRGADRRVDTYAGAFLVGSALIYVPGVMWLMHYADMSLTKAMESGVYPFLLGDCLKAAAAGLLLPLAWRAVRGHRGPSGPSSPDA